MPSPEFKKAMAALKRADAAIINVLCEVNGFPVRHPLRKQFRTYLRVMAKVHAGDRTKPSPKIRADVILIRDFLRVRDDKEMTAKEQERALDNAILDYANNRKLKT
jgi:hypothetical protein